MKDGLNLEMPTNSRTNKAVCYAIYILSTALAVWLVRWW